MAATRIAVVAGTRPEAIKLAPVVHALRRRPGIATLFVSTGQHREMLQQALAAFALEPDLDLDVMRSGQDLHDVTIETLARLKPVLREWRPAWVVVQGDTTTAMAAALAAFYDRLPVAHVEAGLRTNDRYHPFPEELNRRIVDQLSTALFAPTALARDALLREGFPDARILVTGNTVVDAIHQLRAAGRTRGGSAGGLELEAIPGRVLLVTSHRRESFGEGLAAICRALVRIVERHPDVTAVYPVHLNPNVDGPVRAALGGHPRIVLLPPVPYVELSALLERSYLVLTDSGGIQEEAPSYGKPVLVLRDVTERPEGVAAGVAAVVGTDEERIVAETSRLLDDRAAWERMATGENPYGDGRAAERIADALVGEAPARWSEGRARAAAARQAEVLGAE
jgi:UDP-N-acetylglucosamine 2-epimerase (non-hydrolysing)